MIRKLLTKVIPQLHQPLLVMGLALEGGQASWVEVDSERQLVYASGSGRFGAVDVAKQLHGRPVRTVIQGRDAFYGLVEEENPDPARLQSHIPFRAMVKSGV